METRILKVVRQGEAFSVQSAKAETGTIQKCNIVLRELIWRRAGSTKVTW